MTPETRILVALALEDGPPGSWPVTVRADDLALLATVADAAADVKANPIDARDRPQAWRAQARLIDALDAYTREEPKS